MLRFGPKLALTGLQAPTLTAPFAKVVDPIVTDPWLRRFLDLECFVLRYGSGVNLMYTLRMLAVRQHHHLKVLMLHTILVLPENLLIP